MAVIAVMPAAGLMISLGKLVQMAGADMSMIFTVGSTMESIGWAIINNLHILFAVAIGGSWAKERAGGAFASVIAFILINVITGALFGISSDMLADPNAVTHTLFGKEILVNGYFTSVLGAPALNMGVFVGIISGFVGGTVYNKYYNYRKLPDALAFFNGKGFESISRRDLNKVYERYAKDPVGFITSTAPNVKLTVKDEQGNALKNFELPYNPIELSEK